MHAPGRVVLRHRSVFKGPLQSVPPRGRILGDVRSLGFSPARAAMGTSFRERAKHSIAGAFCLLLLVGGVAPPRIQAGCSHDVTSRTSRLTGETLAHLELPRFPVGLTTDPAPPVPRRDRPCQGPSCSRGQSLPPGPPPSLSLRSDLWCCPAIASAWNPFHSTDRLDTSDTLHPRHETAPPERPPRLAQQSPCS